MILMAALIYLPLWAVTLFGAVLVLVHNAFDWVNPTAMGPFAGTLWRLLHVPGVLVPPLSGNLWLNLYPLIPWPGIMALGFAFGAFLQWPPAQRHRAMLRVGAASLLAFALLRWSNLYGDPVPWKHQA